MSTDPLGFKRIGLISRRSAADVKPVYDWLGKYPVSVHPQPDLAEQLECGEHAVALPDMRSKCDLVLVVGGDGNMLGAARALADSDIPVVGINLGRVGFLTEVNPSELDKMLLPILQGVYREEYRSLIRVRTSSYSGIALNEVILHSGELAHLVEVRLRIGNYQPVLLHADGVIVASPTGSTAYALSAGGPIVYPAVPVLIIVPMLPQSMSSRPLVLPDSSEIRLNLSSKRKNKSILTLDGSDEIQIPNAEEAIVEALPKGLRLLHAVDYDPFTAYRSKLGWQG